jgi:superfamily I DNA/RNA helicase
LAEDIDTNLAKICSVDVQRRIRVVHLDAWVSEFLKKHGYDYRLLVASDEARAYWQDAMLVAPDDLGLPPSFYEQEWEHVIQAQGISKEADYLRAARLGRGQRLNRLQRQAIWPVFEEYRAILNRHRVKEYIDAMRDARVLLETRASTPEYQAVVVDEAQDMSAEAFKLMRQIVPLEAGRHNDLFIVGDAHQRIYAHRVVLGRCGIDIRGRSRKLRLNYRTTDEIRKWAVALLENCDIDDLDGGGDDNQGYRSLLHGDFPEVQQLPSFEKEVEVIAKRVRQLEAEGTPLSSVCLVARTYALLDQYESALDAKGINHARIQQSDDPGKRGLRTATMHRVKGLEFDAIIIAGVNDDIVPLAVATADIDSDYARLEAETKERSLLYVAATRAKNHVLITCGGQPSRFIGR